ncbi:MAG: RHS repeat-associated core domain-containing protein [Candidatus Brocadiia bacterium]
MKDTTGAVAVQERDLNSDGDFGDDDEVVWYHSNTLYSVYALTDAGENVVERYRYDAYGACTVLDPDFSSDADNASDVDNPYTFTARRLDAESGLMQYRHRYYAPELGRFVSRDPVGYVGSLTLYLYAAASPRMYVDPQGMRAVPAGWEPGMKYHQGRGDWMLPGESLMGFYDRMDDHDEQNPGAPAHSESVFNALKRMAPRAGGRFSVRFLLVPIGPGGTIEGTVSFNGRLESCCHDDGSVGLQLVGSVSVRVEGGVGTSVGGKMHDPRGRGSKWREKDTGRWTAPPERTPGGGFAGPGSMPDCESKVSIVVRVGVYGYASVGVGQVSLGPEFDVQRSFGGYDDPGGIDWTAGIGTGRGTGARVVVYGEGEGTGQIVVE